MPKAVTSLTGFVKKVEQIYKAASGDLYYRGHPDSDYSLMPSVFRSPSFRRNEKSIIYKAISESPKDFSFDKYFFDRLVRAQHYGIPTRLLDITLNPMIALYFSCEKSPERRGQVIVFEAAKGQSKFFLSDTVSCKANLAQLTSFEIADIQKKFRQLRQKIFATQERMALLDLRISATEQWSELIEEFNKASTTKRLVQFIREEKPYFEGKIDPIDLIKPDIVIPKKDNARIAAQSGAFLAFGTNISLTDSNAARQGIRKTVIDIAADKKGEIIRALQAIGIGENFVYPEFERTARHIRSLYAS